MPNEPEIAQPLYRSPLRLWLGREYFIFKRYCRWLFGGTNWARPQKQPETPYLVFRHHSPVLRPLQGVDMRLQENKRTNLALALRHIDGTVIAPGQTFSVWRLVGRPTRRKGYLPGLVLANGQITSGTGGGLCQLGNLLFWLFAHSALEITERYRHSYDVFPGVARSVPFGAGATLAYNYIDLQVRNLTPHHFRIRLWLDDSDLNGELLCSAEPVERYRVEERDHRIVRQPWGGYTRHNRIVRVGEKSGEETLMAVNHAVMMYAPLLDNKGKPTP